MHNKANSIIDLDKFDRFSIYYVFISLNIYQDEFEIIIIFNSMIRKSIENNLSWLLIFWRQKQYKWYKQDQMAINLPECFKVKTGINRYESDSTNISLVIFSQPTVRLFGGYCNLFYNRNFKIERFLLVWRTIYQNNHRWNKYQV